MSMISRVGNAAPTGEVVTSFSAYDRATKAVSTLIEQGVPASDIAIIGRDLKSVEKVTTRLGWARVAWTGAINGMLLGLLFAAFMAIWQPEVQIGSFAGLVVLGVAMGMLFRLISYSIIRRRRDFASVMHLSAATYDIAVQPESVGKARQSLGRAAERARPATVDLSVPPKYGVRVPPNTATPEGDQPR